VGKIAILPPAVQGQIAAGEVVERPASVVKELVENALDAGATRIEVRLAGGGVHAIVVRDDGEGMAPEDALLAFGRHATSKLADAEGLESVGTFGFRGEALPSIAAVARVHVVTRRASDQVATVVDADGEGARAGRPVGAPPGTTVEVEGLFASTPARRKFLRTPATEVGHVVDVLTRLAVACPSVGIRLEHDGREVLHHPPVRDAHARLAQVLGPQRSAALVPVDATLGGFRVTGWLGAPREHLSSARLVWTYVAIGAAGEPAPAGRWVRDRLLLRAVLDGYEGLLMRGRYPIAVLTLVVPPGDVDVNVHPAKLEVRFRRSAAVHQLIVPTLRARLAAALKPAPASGETVAEPPAPYAARRPSPDAVPQLPLVPVTRSAEAPAAAPAAGWSPQGFARLRFVGQVFDGYLLCEGDGRMVLIDQHAAHERVTFERLKGEQAHGGVARDALLVPEAVALPPAQAALLGEHAADLAAAGLEGEPFGPGTFLLRTVPRLLRGRDAGALLRAVASELAEEGASAAGERARDDALATLACHSSVRVGQRLDETQVRALLEQMDAVDVNAHCPHGRPVAIELRRAQVEGWFGR